MCVFIIFIFSIYWGPSVGGVPVEYTLKSDPANYGDLKFLYIFFFHLKEVPEFNSVPKFSVVYSGGRVGHKLETTFSSLARELNSS